MASTITHALFINDVYDKLELKLKKFLIDEKETLKVASQSMDILYFYKIIFPNKGNDIREFGDFFHYNNTQFFFTTMVNYIKEKKYYNDPKVMAYLYGLLSHLILDSAVHPFIVYKTGIFNKNDKNTYKYNMLHSEFESYLDNYLISLKFNINPIKFKNYKFCFNLEKSDKLSDVINFTFNKVFEKDNFSTIYYKSLSYMKFFYRIFRYDPLRVKKIFYKFVDLISPKSYQRKVPLSYSIRSMKSYMNLEHKEWYNPCDKSIKSNLSILDLYTNAVNDCIDIVNKVNDYIYNDIGDINKIIPNVSYKSGIDLEQNSENYKYFEF